MALTPSGAISFGDINTALGRSATASISINDTQVRFIAAQYSGAITINNLRNRYNWNGTAPMTYYPGTFSDVYGYINVSTGATGNLLGNAPPRTWSSADDGTFPVYSTIEASVNVSYPSGNFRARTGTSGGVLVGVWSPPGSGYSNPYIQFLSYSGDPLLVTYADTLGPQPMTWQVSSA